MANKHYFLPAQRGGKILVLDNYLYTIKRKSNGISFWRCRRGSYYGYCPATVKMKGEDIILKVSGDHNHDTDCKAIITKEIKEEMKERAVEEDIPMMKIYCSTVEKYASTPGIAALLPQYKGVEKTLYKTRRAKRSILPHTVNDLSLTESGRKVNNVEEYVLPGDGIGEERLGMAESSLSSSSNVLKFFMLIGELKHTKRTGWVRSKVPDCETIAGHMYRMGVMAFLLGDQNSSNLDRNKCIKMALVHDMAECIVGDITPFCGVSAEEKHSREVAAMKSLSSLVGEEVGAEFLNLFMEYEEKQTAESKFVHDLDKFDMILQAFEYEKESNKSLNLQQFFKSTEGIFQNPMVLQWVAELNKLRDKPSSDNSV